MQRCDDGGILKTGRIRKAFDRVGKLKYLVMGKLSLEKFEDIKLTSNDILGGDPGGFWNTEVVSDTVFDAGHSDGSCTGAKPHADFDVHHHYRDYRDGAEDSISSGGSGCGIFGCPLY